MAKLKNNFVVVESTDSEGTVFTSLVKAGSKAATATGFITKIKQNGNSYLQLLGVKVAGKATDLAVITNGTKMLSEENEDQSSGKQDFSFKINLEINLEDNNLTEGDVVSMEDALPMGQCYAVANFSSALSADKAVSVFDLI